ncbi:MAG: AAA family ATPase [Azospirillum sp.]|nr:AAA family ATPase [Azospirillum sp.]
MTRRNHLPEFENLPILEIEPRAYWRSGTAYRDRYDHPHHRIWSFLVAEWPELSAKPIFISARRLDAWSLIELAIMAEKQKLDEDIEGSLWFLAAHDDFIPAVAMLLRLLLNPRSGEPIPADRRAAAVYWRKRILRTDALENSGTLGRDFSRLGELSNADVTVIEDLKLPLAQRRFLIPCPTLLSELENDKEMKSFASLGKAMPIWRPLIRAEILEETLKLEFPHFADVISSIVQAVIGTGDSGAPAVLLLGPPGIGKDSLWRRACELSGRPFAEHDLAGSSDSRTLRGTSKGWSSRTPSYPATIIRRLGFANPIIVMNELDKAGGNRANGVIGDTLLSWLEPGSRAAWFDEGLNVPIDLSRVTFGFSANNLESIPGPLRSRLRIIEVGSVKPTHVAELLERTIQRYVAAEQIRRVDMPEIDKRVLSRLQKLARTGKLNLRMLARVVAALVEIGPRPGSATPN